MRSFGGQLEAASVVATNFGNGLGELHSKLPIRITADSGKSRPANAPSCCQAHDSELAVLSSPKATSPASLGGTFGGIVLGAKTI